MATFKLKKGGSSVQGMFDGTRSVTIKSAKYDFFNEDKFLELTFEDFPETIRCRLYEDKKNDEPMWKIMPVFRFTNTGVSFIGSSEDETIVKVDDTPSKLVGKKIGVYTYKNNKGYWRVAPKVFPVMEFQNDVETITNDDISFYEQKAIEFVEKYARDRVLPGAEKVKETDSTSW